MDILRDTCDRFRSSIPSRQTILSTLLVIALAPKLLTYGGIRVLDDPIFGTVTAIVIAEWQPLAGLGFIVLLAYLVVSEALETRTGSDGGIEGQVSSLIGLGIALLYTVFLVAMWIDPRAVGTWLVGTIKTVSRTIYTSSLVALVDPVFIRSVELALVDLVRSFEYSLLRSPGLPTRWPLYLFVAYVAVAELIERAGWFGESAGIIRYPVRLIGAVLVLIYGLVHAHNHFPGHDTGPWPPETIVAWLALHSGVSILILVLSKRSISTSRYRTASFVWVTAFVYLLLGIGVAVLDRLYPIPEIVLLGASLLLLVERHYSHPILQRVEVQVTDLVSRFANALAETWSEPSKLVSASMAVEGFFLAGWMVWALLFSVGGLFGPPEKSFGVAVVFTLAFSPVLVASTYIMWYWVAEIERIASGSTTAPRSPDLLGFPTLALASFFTLEGGLGSILLALCGILVSLYGMYASIQGSFSAWVLPRSVNRHAVLLAFLVQFGGLIAVSHLTTGIPEANTSHLELLVLTLVPTYIFMHVRRDALSRLVDILPEIGVVLATLLLLWIVSEGWSLDDLSSGIVGLGAVSLMVVLTCERVIGLVRR